MPYLSVIIPAYNEEQRIPSTLRSVHDFLQSQGNDFEIVVIDDGSHDRTVDVVDEFARTHVNVRVVSYQPNRGKGHAIRTGIFAAHGDLLLINDADGSSPIEEVVKLESGITDGADLAIGSRAKPDQSRVVKALIHRKFIGNTFNLIVQSLLLPGIYDTQCGFKLFKRTVARDIFSVGKIDGYGFDVEVLYIAKLRGYKTSEIAISWSNVEGSKVNVWRDSIHMFIEVIKIFFTGFTGQYKRIPEITHQLDRR